MENGTITMPSGEAIAEIDAKEYTSYQLIKYDWEP
jgi:hypothetical protein